ncbi:SDR family NAD(P)-dependent oxidoreductase [Streptomyces chrestomyceticus]|uniref:SDR family NAD(P)-dependent oxidoreductase n=1 Tax=Streptomyces chrestomyceticus TaxID=68185 RepID=UPI00379230E8
MAEQKVAIVTGSSSGIGAAIATRLANEGYRVVVNSARSVAEGRALAASLPAATYVQADVSDEAQARALIATAAEQHGRIDVLVNNAGTTKVVPHDDLEAVTPQVWWDILSLNVLGTWQVSVAAVPHLSKSATPGNIVNISSVAGTRPVGSSIPYAVSKAAVNHLTRLLAAAVGPGIRVNSVAPALTETAWTADDPFFRAIADKCRESTPLRRVGTAEDVADTVSALLRLDHMTGAVLPVDGGAALI